MTSVMWPEFSYTTYLFFTVYATDSRTEIMQVKSIMNSDWTDIFALHMHDVSR
jgi:hypothetical protein